MTKNKMTLQYIEHRLYEWAVWFGSDNEYSLGYKSCSLEYRMMMEGMIIKQNRSKQMPCHKEAEEMEKYIGELAYEAPDVAFALRQHYFASEQLHVKYHANDLKGADLKRYIERGHQWLIWRMNHFREEG